MVLPLIPIAAMAGGTIVGTVLGFTTGSKKAETTLTDDGTGSGGGIFPAVSGAPFSLTSPTYNYNPDNSQQNTNSQVYHSAYENFQPVITDASQYTITYPTYAINIDSAGASANTSSRTTADQQQRTDPSFYQPASYNTAGASTDKSSTSGLDLNMLIIAGAALGAVYLIGQVITK